MPGNNVDWSLLSGTASLLSHRLVGWIYWDPSAIERYAALGVPDGQGYYIASRAAPLAAAGPEVVTAAFYSIHPAFIRFSLELASRHTTFPLIAEARDAAVAEGLRRHVPEICDELTTFGPELWAVADALPASGCVLFAAHRQWPRPADPLVSAWLAVNCLRERRGDVHWAIVLAEGLTGVQAGLLHNEFLRYPPDWVPTSRGADAAAIAAAMADLETRGLATDGAVNPAGIRLREQIEERTDRRSELPWRMLGEQRTRRLIELIEPVGGRLLARIDATAGPQWMPAGRDRPV